MKLSNEAIRREWELGKINLPTLIKIYFNTKRKKILKYELERKNAWLITVRKSRENAGRVVYEDEFTKDKIG